MTIFITPDRNAQHIRIYPGFLLLFFILMLTNACSVPLTYYDNTTYTNLTNLKVETTLLIQSFDKKPPAENADRIELVTINLLKAYEYEKGKGKPNNDTVAQFEKIIRLYNDDVTNYRDSGPGTLGNIFYTEASIILGQAFDIAIATENLKNRNK